MLSAYQAIPSVSAGTSVLVRQLGARTRREVGVHLEVSQMHFGDSECRQRVSQTNPGVQTTSAQLIISSWRVLLHVQLFRPCSPVVYWCRRVRILAKYILAGAQLWGYHAPSIQNGLGAMCQNCWRRCWLQPVWETDKVKLELIQNVDAPVKGRLKLPGGHDLVIHSGMNNMFFVFVLCAPRWPSWMQCAHSCQQR